MNDASSGSFGYYTSGPEAGCEVNLSGGAALCPTGGGQVAPMGSGVPGASWGRFLLGAAVVLTVGAVAEAALPEVAGAGEALAGEAGLATSRAAAVMIVFALASLAYRAFAWPGQGADETPEGHGVLWVPTPTPEPTPTPTQGPMMCPAHPYTGPYDGPVT
jgi:hypothetical protein